MMAISESINLRWRLLRRVSYRGKRAISHFLNRFYIRQVQGLENIPSLGPSIFICSYTCDRDFLVLPTVLNRELVFLAPRNIPSQGIIEWLLRTQFTVRIAGVNPGYRFFREVMRQIIDYNRSIAVYPRAAGIYAKEFQEKYVGIVKIAIKASVPVVPIVTRWDGLKKLGFLDIGGCSLEIGKKIYISPDNAEFHDIFFKKRGFRKYSSLSKEDFQEIGKRIMLRLGN